MEEIRIYRGIDKETKKWVYGYCVLGVNQAYICTEERPGLFNIIPVYYRTIGMILNIDGLGKQVAFEGDLILSKFGRKYELVYFNGEILAQSEIGFRYHISDIIEPKVIGNIYKEFQK